MSVEKAMSDIFDSIKKKGSLNVNTMFKEIDGHERIITLARNKLMNEYQAIEFDGSNFHLSLTANKYKDLKSYLKSLRKSNLTKYQKIYLTLFILFGAFGVYKVLKPSVSPSQLEPLNSRIDSLNTLYDSLRNEHEYLKLNLDSIKLQVSKSTSKLPNDTSKTKKAGSSKTQ